MNLYLLPQFLSSIAVLSFCFLIGMQFGFLTILIPYFSKNNSTQVEDSFTMSDNELSWLLSGFTLVKPISSVLAGLVMDHFGRLNTLRLGILPWSIGWILIANASNFPMLMTGFLTAFVPCSWFVITSLAYVSEISSPNMRGVLLNFKSIFWGLGSIVPFLLGAFLHWRMLAWVNCILFLIPGIATLFLKESMMWLVTKGRIDDAKESLIYFNRYRKTDENLESDIERKLLSIQALHERYHSANQSILKKMRFFLQPSGYKRILMIAGLQCFNEATGSNVLLNNIIVFFTEFGTTVNPYAIGIYIGITKLATSLFTGWLLKTCKFKSILIANYLTICGCMLAFGLYLDYNTKGTTIYQWIPLCTMVLYTFSLSSGVYSVPVVITPLIFPTHLRGTGQSVATLFQSLMEFSATQTYYLVKKLVKHSHILYVMALSSVIGCAYIYKCVVETHKKSFSEIEDYFSKKVNCNKNNSPSGEELKSFNEK
uniref:Major facilitator superfamily (MFS) profile domain-containing protein n=2 Tax=Photinus pyralis TaxID=7054 RepID=A0A1Y1KQQ0_PHOPY